MRNIKLGLLSFLLFLVGASTDLGQTSSYNGVVFSFKLTDVANEENKASFKVGEDVVIKTTLENCSTEMFPWIVTDNSYLYRFTLIKIGQQQPVAYRSDKAEILSLREETPGAGMWMTPDPILPGDLQKLDTLKLRDRYENLSPGKYKLSIEYKTGKFVLVNGVQKRLRLTSEMPLEIVP